MSYAELSVVLNEAAAQNRLLTSSEIKCIESSLKNPFLKRMLIQYPLFEAAKNVLQKTIQHIDQNAPRRNVRHNTPVSTRVHDIAFSSAREQTRRYLQQKFPAIKRPDLIERLEDFVTEALALPDLQKELEIAEASRYKERVREFNLGRLSDCASPKNLQDILKDFHHYIAHLRKQYQLNTTFAWNELESLLNRMNSLSHSKEKEIARNSLIRAIDDARAAYDLEDYKYIDGTDFSCLKGLTERLLDHHYFLVPDVQTDLDFTDQAIMRLISPFAEKNPPDIEHGGVERHCYTPLLYQLYTQAAGYRFELQSKQLLTLKNGVDSNELKQQYLNQLPYGTPKARHSQAFRNIIAQLKSNLLYSEDHDDDPVVEFLDRKALLNRETYTENKFIAPTIEKTEEKILHAMVTQGPFIDRAHLEVVLAWHDPKASLKTMKDSLLAGLAPNFMENIPSKEFMIEAYDQYLNRVEDEQTKYYIIDFMHSGLISRIFDEYIMDIFCTQRVLCDWLSEHSQLLNQNQKEKLAVLCAAQGYANALSLLIRYGVNPNYFDKELQKPLLFIAIKYDHIACVQALIAAEVNLMVRNGKMRMNALMWAVVCSHQQSVDCLIQANFNLNLTNAINATALIIAAEFGEVEIARILIDAGAKLELKNATRQTALIIAAQRGRIEIVEMLLAKKVNIDVRDSAGYTALIWAARKGYVQCVNALIKSGANLEFTVDHHDTALSLAVQEGYVDVVKALIDAGANIDSEDIFKKTALMFAIQKGRVEVAKALILAGARLRADDEIYVNPKFHPAIKQQLQEVINNINLVGAEDTPLMSAARHGDLKACQNLLQQGANLHHYNIEGKNALDIAIMSGHIEVIKELMSYPVTPCYLMKSIRYVVENPAYHAIAAFLFQQDIAEIMLRLQPDVIEWAKTHRCDAAIIALNEAYMRLNPIKDTNDLVSNSSRGLPIIYSKISSVDGVRHTASPK